MRDDVGTIAAALVAAAAERARARAVDAEWREVEAELLRVRLAEERWQREARTAVAELAAVTGASPFAVLRRWFGSGEARASAARARIAEARAQQDTIDRAAAPLLQRHDELASARRTLADAAARYDAAARAKDAAVQRAGGELAAKAQRSAALVAELAADARRLDAAVARVREAEGFFVAAREHLASASRATRTVHARHAPRAAESSGRQAWESAAVAVERARRLLEALGDALGEGRHARAVRAELGDLLAPGAISWPAAWSGPSATIDGHGRAGEGLDRVRRGVLVLERASASARDAHAAALAARETWLEGTAIVP